MQPETAPVPAHQEEEEAFSGGALQWGLRKFDAWLSEKETKPSQADKAAWALGSGPIGTTASKGVSQAAQLSLKVGQKAVLVRPRLCSRLLEWTHCKPNVVCVCPDMHACTAGRTCCAYSQLSRLCAGCDPSQQVGSGSGRRPGLEGHTGLQGQAKDGQVRSERAFGQHYVVLCCFSRFCQDPVKLVHTLPPARLEEMCLGSCCPGSQNTRGLMFGEFHSYSTALS